MRAHIRPKDRGRDGGAVRAAGGYVEMSTEVAAGTDEINEVMASGGQLGVATEHLSDFTRVMIDLGNSCEDLNAGDAATTIAQFANMLSILASFCAGGEPVRERELQVAHPQGFRRGRR